MKSLAMPRRSIRNAIDAEKMLLTRKTVGGNVPHMAYTACRRVSLVALTLAMVGASSTVAMASSVDFRTASSPSGSTWSTTVDGVKVTVSVGPSGSSLYWDSKDGFGVKGSNGYEGDEVEGAEWLTVSFSEEVKLGDIYLTDLFTEPSNSAPSNAIKPPAGYTYSEKGTYTLANGTAVGFLANTDAKPDPETNGEKTLSVNTNTTGVTLTAPGMQGATQYTYKVQTGTKYDWRTRKYVPVYSNATGSYYAEDHDYSLAGLTFSKIVSSVPELDGKSAYAALGLLIGGLLAATSRRRRAAAKSA
jgi:hypothetical protein